MIFCQSVSAVWVVSTVISAEDTQTLTAIIELVWTFSGDTEMLLSYALTSSHSSTTTSHLVKLSLPNILNIYHFIYCFWITSQEISLIIHHCLKKFNLLAFWLVVQKSDAIRPLPTKGIENEAYFENNQATNFVEKACASNWCQMSLLHPKFSWTKYQEGHKQTALTRTAF